MEPGLDGWQAFHTDILKTCAELFAHGPEWTREPSMYSLHRWNECVRNIGDHEQSGAACTVADALGWVLNRVAEESRYDILALARSIWRRVHGTAETTVRDRLAQIVEIARGTRMTGAVCFSGPEPHVQNVVGVLGTDPRWMLLDLRGMEEAAMAAAISRAGQSGILVLATGETIELPGPVRRPLGAARDGFSEIQPYLLTWGCSFEPENEARGGIDIWDDVDEFE